MGHASGESTANSFRTNGEVNDRQQKQSERKEK